MHLPFVVCTIYNGNFFDPVQARCVRVAVALFNDVIARIAREHGVPVIELRSVCIALKGESMRKKQSDKSRNDDPS